MPSRISGLGRSRHKRDAMLATIRRGYWSRRGLSVQRRLRHRIASIDARPAAQIGLRLRLFGFVIISLFALLVVRLGSLQVLHTRKYKDEEIATVERIVNESVPRGVIVARAGQVFAGNSSTEEIEMTNQSAKAHPESITHLALLLNTTVRTLGARLANNQYLPYQAIPLVANPPIQDMLYIQQNPGAFLGVSVTTVYERDYPQGDLAAQVLGYVGDISASELKEDARYGYASDSVVGQTGLEEQYNHVLEGQPGIEIDEVNSLGDVVSSTLQSHGSPGDTVVTHLSLGLELQLQNDLTKQVGALRSGTTASGAVPAPWAAGVVLDVHDGAVLAMASYPTYNDNDWIPSISTPTYNFLLHEDGGPLNNYALVGAEPPGSTFKIATATAALNLGLITPNYYYQDPGSFTLPTGQVLTDAPGDAGGDFDVASALSYSSDVFFYNLGEMFYDQSSRYGKTPIQNAAKEYGLGEPSGIDLPNVDNGQVDSLAERKVFNKFEPDLYGPATWYVGDNVEMAFGQGETLVTPLEIADTYASFANGGTRYAPEVATAIESSNGSLVRRIMPRVMSHVSLPASTYQAMLAGFKGAVTNPIGTAYSDFVGFDFSKWNLAGKTGTATVSHTSQPVSWFVAFGGPKGQPAKYAFCVEFDEAGYGADAAAPVVREVANYLMENPLGPVHLAGASSGDRL